jgi:predicted nucleic acid-binding protein
MPRLLRNSSPPSAILPKKMAWLIDTDLLSERTKRQPAPELLEWLEKHASEIYTSTHVIGELQAGISALAEGIKKRGLQAWLNRLTEAMEGRILNFNTSVATIWGRQEAEYSVKGCPMPMPDSFIAATARRYNLIIATRNVRDYRRPGLKAINPFDLNEPKIDSQNS